MDTPNFNHLLMELKDFNLPLGEFVIFGSGPLAARGIRDCKDLDIIVSENLYQKICQKYPEEIYLSDVGTLQIGDFEISQTWLNDKNCVKELIAEAEILHGYPFVNLNEVINWKKSMGRVKDLTDLKLIDEYLEKL